MIKKEHDIKVKPGIHKKREKKGKKAKNKKKRRERRNKSNNNKKTKVILQPSTRGAARGEDSG